MIKNTSCLFTVSAPSGAGKTSLVKALLEKYPEQIAISISHATREQRVGEVDGQDYHFVSIADFEAKVKQNGFLEHAKVFDNYYGTSRQAVDDLLAEDKNVILEIDWQGAEQIKKVMPETVSIFILPPSREALYTRLNDRGQDNEEIINKRMANADSEMSHYDQAEYLIINDDFDTALEQLARVLLSQSLTMQRQKVRNEALLKDIIVN
ncbi:MAG: guanylate kinase [Gammaproteobacteria bacterium]|nr:guanylate kinase [Gammaproteobacteria bacterium]